MSLARCFLILLLYYSFNPPKLTSSNNISNSFWLERIQAHSIAIDHSHYKILLTSTALRHEVCLISHEVENFLLLMR